MYFILKQSKKYYKNTLVRFFNVPYSNNFVLKSKDISFFKIKL